MSDDLKGLWKKPPENAYLRDVTIRVSDNFKKSIQEFSLKGEPSFFSEHREGLIDQAADKLRLILGRLF